MSKFKFICENDDNSKIQYEYESDYLYDLVVKFEDFLRGCGFSLGHLKIDNEDLSEKEIEGPYKFQYPNMNDEFDLKVFYESDDVNFTPDSDYSPPVEQKYDARCFLCGIEKEIMKGYTCHDVKCPKGTW